MESNNSQRFNLQLHNSIKNFLKQCEIFLKLSGPSAFPDECYQTINEQYKLSLDILHKYHSMYTDEYSGISSDDSQNSSMNEDKESTNMVIVKDVINLEEDPDKSYEPKMDSSSADTSSEYIDSSEDDM